MLNSWRLFPCRLSKTKAFRPFSLGFPNHMITCSAGRQTLDTSDGINWYDGHYELLKPPHKRHVDQLEKSKSEKPPKETFGPVYQQSIQPDSRSYATLLRWSSNVKAFAPGKGIHIRIIESGNDRNRLLGNLLVQMYGNCGELNDACTVLLKIHPRDVFSWTFMIRAYIKNGQSKNALESFQQMKQEGIVPNASTFPCLLAACASEALLSEGIKIHATIVGTEFEKDLFVETALINLYGVFKRLEDAQSILDEMTEHNLVSWNAMITVYTRQGKIRDALHLLKCMPLQGFKPDKFTVASIFAACASSGALSAGQQIHAQLVITGLESDSFVGNGLVHMYGKCGILEDAKRIFCNMSCRDMVSWTIMITLHVQHGQEKVVQLIEQMQVEGCMPDKVSFVSILSACASHMALAKAKQMHASIACTTFGSDVTVGNALVNMYGKCGSLVDALAVFDRMPERDVISWTSMISSLGLYDETTKALQLFVKMQLTGLIPNKVTFITVLDVCANQAALRQGEWMHSCILSSGFEFDGVVGNSLLSMYGKCGSLGNASISFSKMHERDVVSWNCMIEIYVRHGQFTDALQMFEQMLSEKIGSDTVTVVIALSACACKTALNDGRKMHVCLLHRGINFGVVLGNSLVNMYGKCGSLEDAKKIFDVMAKRDVISWNALLACYAQHGLALDSINFFQKMQLDGILPNHASFGIILFSCSHTGLVDKGCDFFISMNQDHCITPTLEHVMCMVDLLGRVGRLEEGENLIKTMPFKATALLWMTLLSACKTHVDVERGEHAANHLFRLDPGDATPYILLSSIYDSAANQDHAIMVRNMVKDRR